jgi:hypothetical protein
MKRRPRTRSGPAAWKSVAEIRAWLYSTIRVMTWPNFSSTLGIIRGRNRRGFDPMTRNAICHAMATEKKP